MKERSILFNGAMVRAILSGAKTQTRRVLKQATGLSLSVDMVEGAAGVAELSWLHGDGPGYDVDESTSRVPCPFGQPGDRLWVRETHAIFPAHGQHRGDGKRWGPWGGLPTTVSEDGERIAYYREGFDRCNPGRWRPSIHMPRWACRLVLEITDVRVERLQAISEADAIAEGIDFLRHAPDADESLTPQQLFHCLWDGTGGDWDSNPWVWAITFKRIEA